jgi:hypothetical protein
MMKKTGKLRNLVVRIVVFAFVACSVASLTGCGSTAQLGETEAEGRRRHARINTIRRQQLMADIDVVWMMDKPSGLTNKRLP